MPIYMLDTNAVSYAMKRKGRVLDTMLQFSTGTLLVSAITVAELEMGLAKNPHPQNRRAVESTLSGLKVMTFDVKAAQAYGKLYNDLRVQGLTLANMDLLIASHAQSLGAILVSSDKNMKNALDTEVVDWF